MRVHTLANANVWWDEGFTTWLARYDVPGMLLRTAEDTHPPLSYLLFHFWLPLAGHGAFGLRFLSLVFGVATIPLVGSLGTRLGGQTAGAASAFLLSLARFHVWWSQQIRMYSLVALLVAASLYLLLVGLREWKRDRRRSMWLLAGLAVVNLAGLYTLYFFAVLIGLESLLVLGLILNGRDLRLVGAWTAIQLVSIALLLPWLDFFRAHAITFSGPAAPPLTLSQFAEATWSELALGIDTQLGAVRPLNAILLLLALLLLSGLLFRLRGWRRAVAAWLLLSAICLPTLAYLATTQKGLFFSPTYETRYALLSLPSLVVLFGWGVSRLPGLTKLLPLALFAGAAVYSLPQLYTQRHLVDDYYSAARFIEAYEQPGDAIVFDPDWYFNQFLFVYEGRLPWEGLPLNQQLDASQISQLFSIWTQKYGAIWLVQVAGGHDAGAAHQVRDWLKGHMQPDLELAVGDKLVSLYRSDAAAPRQLRSDFRPEHPLDRQTPGLIGFDQPLNDVRPGDLLRIALYGAPPSAPGIAFAGNVFSARQFPNLADFTLPINAAVPAGQLPIELVLPDGRRLPISSVNVEAHAPVATTTLPALATFVNRAFGSNALLTSYDLAPQSPHAGQPLNVQLQWHAESPFAQDYSVFVHLLDAQNHVVAQHDGAPADGAAPTVQWVRGQTIDDTHTVELPGNLPAGQYAIEIGMYLKSTGERLKLGDDPSQDHLILGQVTVGS